jgi:sec-independent protein translocase protein TatA
MGDLLQPWHLILLAVVVFLLFGARRLPELGKGLGEGLKGFREGIKGITDPGPSAPTQQSTVNAAPQSASTSNGKATYRCPNCKNVLTANAPNPDAVEDKGFCPECGSQFDKKAALV